MKKLIVASSLIAVLVVVGFYGCKNMGSSSGSSSGSIYNSKSKPATAYGNELALKWVDMLLDQVRTQRVGPPPTARALGYLGIAMYQSVVAGIPDGHSLEGQLKGFNNVPKPDPNQEYNWPVVLNNASYIVCDEGLARYMGPNTMNLVNMRD